MMLNNYKIRNLPINKKISDGGGLYLTLSSKKKGKWTYRYNFEGKAKEMGLGPYPEISLSEARDLLFEQRKLKAKGVDPLFQKRHVIRKENELNQRRFSHVAIEYIDDNKGDWKSFKHTQQWHNTLRDYAFNILDEVPFHCIETDHVRKVLKPIWHTKSETAYRVQQRIARVIGYGISLDYRQGPNIADWKGSLNFIFKKTPKTKVEKHFESLPYNEIPEVYAEISKLDTIASRALCFLMLTAGRTNEVIQCNFDEINLNASLWTIPAIRMKAGKEHRVPLSIQALDILNITKSQHNYPYIFHGKNPEKHLSNNSMGKFVRDNFRKKKFTVHGFRSTFRDWAAEVGNYDQLVVEFALAHQLPNRSQAAYLRSDMFDKRIVLMNDWASFVTSKVK